MGKTLARCVCLQSKSRGGEGIAPIMIEMMKMIGVTVGDKQIVGGLQNSLLVACAAHGPKTYKLHYITTNTSQIHSESIMAMLSGLRPIS